MRFDLFEPKGHEGQDRVIHFLVLGRERALGAGGFPGPGRANLVLQFHHNPLGGLLADP